MFGSRPEPSTCARQTGGGSPRRRRLGRPATASMRRMGKLARCPRRPHGTVDAASCSRSRSRDGVVGLLTLAADRIETHD